MKIGYPCINTSINCTANRTFRLKSYSENLLKEKVTENLECLKKTLQYNVENNFLFFRIGSGLVPFASHPICQFDWQKYFKKDFQEIGRFIKENDIRISMHPDQFTVINSKDPEIVERSVKELKYHCQILGALGLDETAKVQIHVGGVYGEKKEAMKRFIDNYDKLPDLIRKRLAIENDDKSYSASDCLKIHKKTGIPIIFDTLHHECLNNQENIRDILEKIIPTWKKKDGLPMVDYSNRISGDKRCRHVQTVDPKLFKNFIQKTTGLNFDIMLEIKDKEASARKAEKIIKRSLM
jgi:UV DNA damage endonuclease